MEEKEIEKRAEEWTKINKTHMAIVPFLTALELAFKAGFRRGLIAGEAVGFADGTTKRSTDGQS